MLYNIKFNKAKKQTKAIGIYKAKKLNVYFQTGSCLLFCPSVASYFNESDLQVAGGCLGHLHQESRLVGVVFHDVVVHVDEDPGERKGRLSEMELKCRRKAN